MDGQRSATFTFRYDEGYTESWGEIDKRFARLAAYLTSAPNPIMYLGGNSPRDMASTETITSNDCVQAEDVKRIICKTPSGSTSKQSCTN